MSPALFRARLGTKRYIRLAPSGSHVAACGRLEFTVPPVTFTWYHREAAKPLVSCRRTVWVAHKDSAPLRFVYCTCIIARICSTSRLFPPCDGAFGTLAFGHDVAATGVSGPVKVESEILFQ